MREEIKEILIECGIDEKDLECTDFVKAGFMDSMAVAEVAMGIEDKYQIDIDGKDIIPEWFMNVDTMESLVKKYLK